MSSFRDFLFNRDHSDAWSLVFAMTGVRLGERQLLIGDDAELFARLAGKVGLTGHLAVVVASEHAAARVEAAAASAGVLIEDIRRTTLPEVPGDPGQFDLAVLNAGPVLLSLRGEQREALARHVHRALRMGGRAVVVEGRPPRFFGLVRTQPEGLGQFHAEGGATRMLEAGGFRPVRVLADRDGQRFTEGLKTA